MTTTTTHFSKFSSDGVSFISVDDKTTVVNGQKVPYKTGKFSYDHEDDQGRVVTADLSFEMPECKITYGLTLEKGYNLKGKFEFSRDSKDAKDCVASVSRTQTKGWVSVNDVDVEMDVGSCTATPRSRDDPVPVYLKPDDNGVIVGNSRETMDVVGKSPDKNYLSVVFGGTEGFFDKLRRTLAGVAFSNKEKFDLGDKTEDQIFNMITDPVYISKDKKTGKLLDRDPAVYFNVVYYPQREANGDKPAMRERLARFEVPGMDECLALDILTTKCVTCIPTIKVMHLTKTGSKLSMKIYVTGACVTDIEDIKKTVETSAAYNKFSQNPALVEKLRQKMEKVKLETPVPKEDAPVENGNQEPQVTTTPNNTPEDDFNLETMLNSDAPVLDAIDLDI